jgi:soluble lytic murein transglycosylase-like protein
MSVDVTVARVAQLEAMLGLSPAGAPVATPTSTSGAGAPDFAARLASVTGASPTATTTDPSATTATGATGAAAGPGAATPYAAEIDAAAAKYNVDPALLRGLIRQESNFNASAQSPAGARGLTQLMPGTASALGVDPSVPAQAIEGGAKYLRQQLDRFGNDPAKALAAYNAGPGAVQRYGGVPPYAETQNYVRKVLGYAADYRQAAPASAATAAAASVTSPLSAAAATSPVTSVSAPTSVLPYSTT